MATAVESATQISLPIDKEEVMDVSVSESATQISLSNDKEEIIDVSTPVAVDVPETEVAEETQTTQVETEADADQVLGEPSATAVTSEQQIAPTEEEIPAIQYGYLQKRGLKPLRLWKNRYFGFHEEPFPLAQLRLVSKKSLKATSAPREEFEKVNKSLFHNIATATVSGEGLMFYFKSSNPDHVEVPLGVINLEDVQSVATTKASKPYAFCIKTNVRDYILAAPNLDEAKSWVHTIQQKLDSLSTLSNVAETAQYKETYEKLVTRQAFNGKSASTIPTGILSDSEVLSGSDNEKDNEATASKEIEAAETPAPAEIGATEESQVITESTEDIPKRKSVFGGLKSFIKKSEKTSDSSIEVTPVSEESAEVKDASEVSTDQEETSENPVVQAEDLAKAEAVPEVTNAKVESDVDNKSTRPLSFGLPKFFKNSKKEGESTEFTEAVESSVEAESATEAATPDVPAATAPEAIIETEVPGNEEATVATPVVVEETGIPTEQAVEVISVDNVADAEPGSPIKRTLSNLFRSKKSKNSESHVTSVEESTETAGTEEPSVAVDSSVDSTPEVQEVAPVEPESAPEEVQAEPTALVTQEVTSEEVVAETTEESAEEVGETAESTDDKTKKPTLFKRMTFMLRTNTGSSTKSPSATTDSIPTTSSSTSPEVITEAPEEVENVEPKIETAQESVKSH